MSGTEELFTSTGAMDPMDNASFNMTGGGYTDDHSKVTIAVIGTLYGLISLVGITGNCLVVYVVCVKKAMQSVTNLFIMNLALSDVLVCLLAVPFTPISFFQDYWNLGKFLCHLIPFSLGVSVYVSTLTSLAIAIDRYFVIVHPFKPRMKLGVCCLLIAVVWIVSISISLPLAIYIELGTVNENGEIKTKCRESWPIPMSRRFFNLASLVLQYILPFTVITYSYTKVWIILSNRTRPGNTKEKEKLDLRRKKRTNRMLISMVVIFAFCWLPLNCVYLIMEFDHEFANRQYFYTVFFISHAIAMSSTIYNPFLYAWLNDNFRKEFRLILPCFFKAIDYCRRSRKDAAAAAAAATAAANAHGVVLNEVIELDEDERYEKTRLMTMSEDSNRVSGIVQHKPSGVSSSFQSQSVAMAEEKPQDTPI